MPREVSAVAGGVSDRLPSATDQADLFSRRRRDVGQLSKGAIRAQRAQARAKQMRQSLLGSNLLNMSMYNAHAQAQAQANGQGHRPNVMPHHPGAQYAMAESYIPMGYDLDGQPIVQSGYPVQEGMYPGQAVDGDMYRLPPIDPGVMNMGYGEMGWNGEGVEYWDGMGQAQGYDPHEEYYDPAPAGYTYSDQAPGDDFRLPPLLEGSRVGMEMDRRKDEGVDPRMREWARDGQQTPSGHVLFNERLFDGALGSAGIHQEKRDEGLSGFDEAIAQVNDTSW